MTSRASTLLLDKSDEIMDRWEVRANDEVLSALQLESLALRDSLPEMLAVLAQILSTASNRHEVRSKWEQEENTRLCRKHGKERADCREYTISQMIYEYNILRQAICDVLEEQQELTCVEREIIVSSIEQAVNDAATQFTDTVSEAQERLASMLTHDLRAPLTVASLATQKILRRPEDSKFCVQAATRIGSSVERLEMMIQNLLDASLLKAGQNLELHSSAFGINHLVQQLADDFNMRYDGRLMVKSHITGQVHWGKAEICRLEENLTSNAAKYAKPDTSIELALCEEDDIITLSVHNEGEPIPAKEQANLFRQFRRGKGSRRQRGWGLGLTVVKGIVEAHHGSVHIESSAGAGTSFVVRLPRNC